MKKVFISLFLVLSAVLWGQVSFELKIDPFKDIEDFDSIQNRSGSEQINALLGIGMYGNTWAGDNGIDIQSMYPESWVDGVPGWLAGIGARNYRVWHDNRPRNLFKTYQYLEAFSTPEQLLRGYIGEVPSDFYIPEGHAADFDGRHYFKLESSFYWITYAWDVLVEKSRFEPWVSTGVSRWWERLGVDGERWLHSSPLSGIESGRFVTYQPGFWSVNITCMTHIQTGDVVVYMRVRDGDATVSRRQDGSVIGEVGGIRGFYLSAYYKNNFHAGM